MSKWADKAIKELLEGKEVKIQPFGNSMKPHVNSGDIVTLYPITDTTKLTGNMIVLCEVNGNQYLHFIKSIKMGDQYLIGNAYGRYNGWITRDKIFGYKKMIPVTEQLCKEMSKMVSKSHFLLSVELQYANGISASDLIEEHVLNRDNTTKLIGYLSLLKDKNKIVGNCKITLDFKVVSIGSCVRSHDLIPDNWHILSIPGKLVWAWNGQDRCICLCSYQGDPVAELGKEISFEEIKKYLKTSKFWERATIIE